MQESRRSKGAQGETLAAYLPIEDAATIRLRARVEGTNISTQIAKAVRYWLAEDSEGDLGVAESAT
jgi:hypothetical protein